MPRMERLIIVPLRRMITTETVYDLMNGWRSSLVSLSMNCSVDWCIEPNDVPQEGLVFPIRLPFWEIRDPQQSGNSRETLELDETLFQFFWPQVYSAVASRR